MGRPSKQQLDTVFGTHNDTDVVTQILEKGDMQAASECVGRGKGRVTPAHHVSHPAASKDGYSTTNDSKQGQNVSSMGASGGGR